MMQYVTPRIRTQGFRYDADSEVTCYLIHGFTGSTFELEGLGEYLACNRITAVADLLPGHGTTIEDCNSRIYRDWIEAVVCGYTGLKEEKREVFLAGFSMGAVLAVYLASRSVIPGLVLYAPAFKFKGWKTYAAPVMARFKEFEYKEEIHDKDGPLEFFGYAVYPLKACAQVVKLTRKARPLLKKVTCPVIIMHSKADATVPFENGQLVYDSIASKDKQFVAFDNSTHMLSCDCEKEKVWKETLTFIRKHSRLLRHEVSVPK